MALADAGTFEDARDAFEIVVAVGKASSRRRGGIALV
jgi:hypothetical protein